LGFDGAIVSSLNTHSLYARNTRDYGRQKPCAWRFGWYVDLKEGYGICYDEKTRRSFSMKKTVLVGIDDGTNYLPVNASSYSVASRKSLLSFGSILSVLSVFSILGVLSAGSLLSIGSAGSILSIGSSGSILSIGSVGSILSIGSAGSILCVGGKGGVLSKRG
jgi:hypothetical protein